MTLFILQNWPVLRVRLVSPPSTLHASTSEAHPTPSDRLGTPAKAPSTQATTAQLSTPQTTAVSLLKKWLLCTQYRLAQACLRTLSAYLASCSASSHNQAMEELSSLPSPRAADFQELSQSALAKVRAPAAFALPASEGYNWNPKAQLFPFSDLTASQDTGQGLRHIVCRGLSCALRPPWHPARCPPRGHSGRLAVRWLGCPY